MGIDASVQRHNSVQWLGFSVRYIAKLIRVKIAESQNRKKNPEADYLK